MHNSFYKISLLLLFTLSSPLRIFSQDLVINEIMTSNITSYTDEFGSTPDWIEIYNNSSQSIDLGKYFLSDEKVNLDKWKLPSIELASHEFLLIALSGRNINNIASAWKTVIKENDIWKYFIGDQEPPLLWKNNEFNDLSWSSGFSGFGYGDGDDNTIIENVNSIYLRKSFDINDVNNISQVMFNIDYDDGYVAYINGIEISKENIEIPSDQITYLTNADISIEPRLINNQKLDAVFVNNLQSFLVDGRNILSIQIHNSSISSSDLSAIPFLTLGYKDKVETENVADELISLLPKAHANFSVANGKESIYLSSSEGIIVDSVGPILIHEDMSYGRYPDGSNSWFYFIEPSPENSNPNTFFLGYVEEPLLDFTPGFYNGILSLHITNNNGLNSYYTLDGSEPTINSNLYQNAITLTKTTVVKIKSFEDGYLPSITNTSTFFINENVNLPVVSISTNPENLWDYDNGIYVIGPNAESEFPFFGANFWQDWEKESNFEFFDLQNIRHVNENCMIKIFGGWSRGNDQKSLAVVPNKSINFNFFDEIDINEFNSLVLRNSGNDWNFTMLRDGFISRIADYLNVDHLAYQPTELYLNGEYWGIHNLREKLNLSYINSHHDIDKDNIDLLELNGDVIDGDNEEYFQLINYLNTHNLNNDENYNYIKKIIDVPSFIDYQIIEIYIANIDWPGNNIKFWKEKGELGKWRWILFDTDFGFGWLYGEDYDHNTLRFALETNGPDWPNPPWSTFILRKLMENANFKRDFINRYSDLINTSFKTGEILQIFNNVTEEIKLAIPRHSERWNQFTYNQWLDNLNVIKRFIELRTVYLNYYFMEEFNLNEPKEIEINVSSTAGGKIKINSLWPATYPWKGKYFKDHIIQLKAIPNPGYSFIGWSGASNSLSDSLEFSISDWSSIQANFSKSAEYPSVVINEINYNSSSTFDTEDWIELFNNSNSDIDLSNWVLKDELDTNIFVIPEGTLLNSNDYLIISRDTLDFNSLVGLSQKRIGEFDFGLNNSGDLIRLFNSEMILIDSVRYDDRFPWPTEPDGSGQTLELINPSLDNSIPSNWNSSLDFGTPGYQNSSFVVEVKKEKELPKEYSLNQNYPNPFNPSTTIEYSIRQSGNVELKIYDVLGNEIKTIVKDKKEPGNYSVDFNAFGYSSGVYFYQLRVNDFIESKKMLLLK
ncbi:MAG: CotH kinase family protein [Ignavibacteriales bacterium]|nr:CotH kinase family protein [Ignavibacteriales bacterium]